MIALRGYKTVGSSDAVPEADVAEAQILPIALVGAHRLLEATTCGKELTHQ